MLDTIHAYASEQLTGSGELRSLQDRHAHFYTQMAVQANTTVFTGSEVKSLAHLRLDYENLRKALIYTLDQPASPALQSERSAMGIRMAAALGYFWDVYLYLADADHWLRRAWDQVEPTTPARDQADLASGLGTLHWQHSRYREAQRWHESALGHYQSAEDWRGICLSLHHLAVVAMSLGDMEQAVALFQECIRSADVSDQHEIQGLGWVGLGNCYLETDLYDQALLPLERGFAMLHSFNLHRALGYAATSLCDIYLRLNRLDQVVCCIEQIEISANLTGDRALQVAAHTYLTQLLRRQKRLVEAHTAWVKALFLLQEIGVNPHLVNSLEEFALFTLEGEDASAALLLLSACEAYRLSYGVHRPSFFQREIDNAFVRIQRLLPPTTLIELRNQGEGLTLEQALTFALERVRIPLSSVTDKIRAPD
jgi:tetratricopeptide (TPR) repeat protein